MPLITLQHDDDGENANPIQRSYPSADSMVCVVTAPGIHAMKRAGDVEIGDRLCASDITQIHAETKVAVTAVEA